MDEKSVNSVGGRDFISPRQLAIALGVSESSIKRWCDQGTLRASRTGGGHRRISLGAVWDFLKATDRQLVDPAALGLPSYAAASPRTLEQASRELVRALKDGHRESAMRIVLDQFLMARRPLAEIFDDIIAPAFMEIGEQWHSGDTQVYQERRATEMMWDILNQLHALIAVPPRSPIAIGGTLENDIYQLPTKMVELVLRQRGWEAATLGCNLPAATLQSALVQLKPQVFWLSCTHIESPENFSRDFRLIWSTAKHVGASLIVGGQAMTSELRVELPFAHYCESMRHLEQLSPELMRVHERTETARPSDAGVESPNHDTAGGANRTSEEPSE